MHTVLRLLQAHRVPAVFDLEGTLVDLEMLHFLSFERTLGEMDVDMTVKEITALQGVVGGGDPFIAALLAKLWGLAAEEILVCKKKHFALLLEEMTIEARPGALAFIESLRSARVPIALASLTPRDRGEDILHRSGLARMFPRELVLFRENVQNPKPHPDVYEEAARRLGVSPRAQIVFEDSPVGVQAAKAAGSRVVAIPSPFFHEEERHMRSLREAGADAFFFHWTDLPMFLPIRAKGGSL